MTHDKSLTTGGGAVEGSKYQRNVYKFNIEIKAIAILDVSADIWTIYLSNFGYLFDTGKHIIA